MACSLRLPVAYGLAVADALCGCPALAAVGGVEQLACHGVAGLVPFGDREPEVAFVSRDGAELLVVALAGFAHLRESAALVFAPEEFSRPGW